jgi:hypothetical protein
LPARAPLSRIEKRRVEMNEIHYASGLPVSEYTVITPYLVPSGTAKKVNIGDGFILDSATKLIGVIPTAAFSSRLPLTAEIIERINAGSCVIAMGANTLKDDFELAPGFDLATLARIKVPVVLMGVGHYGIHEVTRGLTPASCELFRALLERFPYMSVRCDASRRYVTQSLADKAESILMTSCPVVHPVDGIDREFKRKAIYDLLVVTLTDRAMLPAQLPLLGAARESFPSSRRILALHQDYGNVQLWKYAGEQGFEVMRGDDFQDFIRLYAEADVHIGNRVHAHLKCLSNGVTSFCTPFDLRQAFFAESLDFPLIAQAPTTEFAAYDFNRVIRRRDKARNSMLVFLSALKSIMGASRIRH